MNRLIARLTLVVAFLALVTGCGRSSLQSDLVITIADGGPPPDGAPQACSAATCAGCCDATGACVAGNGTAACGAGGVQCQDCGKGFCDATRTCGPPPGCDCPNGCCDATGACQSGQDTATCGSGGGSCTNCALTGAVCNPKLQQCFVPGNCGPCAGCCVGSQCVGGTSDTACGLGGSQCANCAGNGLVCAPDPKLGGGTCTVGCGPTNCGGCCGPKGCVTGTDPSACGSGGQACEACPSTEACEPFGGVAGGGVCLTKGCNPVTCAGCCDSNGLCQQGTGTNDCGSQGLACSSCKNDQACVNGACVTPAQCGPSNCAGCCQGNTCMGGAANASCGNGGQACVDCGSKATCVANACQTNGPCNASSCPNGCCQGNLCLSGQNDSACGFGGSACAPCPTGSQCASGSCQVGASCDPSNCSGCCTSTNDCVAGTAPGTCGAGGVGCVDCGATSQCVNGYCEETCGPSTCAGCCVNGVCAVGTQAGACGAGGGACLNCAASGEACQGGACIKQACGPTTCKGCCDSTGTCVSGTANFACGAAGKTCTNCSAIGDTCSGGNCQTPPPPCNPKTCPLGCCDASGACQDGFLDGQCGSGGTQCVDCSTKGTTCDVNATPRVCSTTQTTCPAPYAGCASGLTTPQPKPLPGACTGQDLAEAQAACAGGADTAGCQAFLQTLNANGAALCETCLQPFVVPFADGTGIFLCVAPFVADPSCNHDTACYADCEKAACSACPAAQLTQCQTNARAGACLTYTQGLTCLQGPFTGGGAFCNPAAYANFGAWLKGVGGHYCQ